MQSLFLDERWKSNSREHCCPNRIVTREQFVEHLLKKGNVFPKLQRLLPSPLELRVEAKYIDQRRLIKIGNLSSHRRS